MRKPCQTWLLLSSVGMGLGAHGQALPGAAAPFRHANAVVVYASAAPATVLRALADNLRQRGFQLDSVDYERGLVTTQPGIPAGTESWPLAVRLTSVPGGVRLTGRVYIQQLGLQAVSYSSEYWGFDWSPAKRTFQELEATAQAYPDGQVRYERQAATKPQRTNVTY